VTDAGAISGNPLRAVIEVSAALVSSTVYGEVLSNLAQRIGEALSVWEVGISAYHPERGIFTFEAGYRLGGFTQDDLDYVGTVAVLSERPDLQRVMDSPGPLIERVTDRSLPKVDREFLEKWGVKTSVDVALRVGGNVVGMLSLEEKRFVRDFTPVELELFGQLCELAAIGVYNAQLFRRQSERSRHLAALLKTTAALEACDDTDGVFAAIAEAAAVALDAPRALVYDYEPATDTLTPRAIYQLEYDPEYDSTGVPETVEEERGDRSVLTLDGPRVEHVSDPSLAQVIKDGLETWGEKTGVTAPMVFGGEQIGVLMLTWVRQERQLTRDDLEMISAIADQAALALRRVRLRSRRSASGPGPGEPAS
jgi:GAF domain-containing protein